MYVHKTTRVQYEQFRSDSKHIGELLHKVFMNETGRGLPYAAFKDTLTKWMRLKFNVDNRTGVIKINEYLRTIFV